jgi:ABC-type uncharacterized transport system auxiliary subunit
MIEVFKVFRRFPLSGEIAVRVFSLCLVVGLAACATPDYRSGAQPMARYDLGPLAALPGGSARPWPVSVTADTALANTGMHYRLLYADPARVRDYAQSRWLVPPAELLRSRLETRLQNPAGAGGRCQLQLDLRRFEQVFTAPTASQVVLQVRAVLHQGDGTPVDARFFAYAKPAASADAVGGVDALAAATDALAAALADWHRAGLASGAHRACGASGP